MNKWPGLLCTVAALSIGQVMADLAAVDTGPYNLATGKYPVWYQDENNLSLELCQSRAVSSRAGGAPNAYMCTLIPDPGVYDDTLPMIFPGNWPGELFWFSAETEIPNNAAGYGLEVYVAAIEAAFSGGEVPVDGQQQSFARIRIRASIPVAGVYKVTHPYGVETITVTQTGRRGINMTRDIGIGAPGNFSGALTGDIGPFLQSVNGPYPERNPDTGVLESFVGDPNLVEPVIGSPNGTNFVKIEGPAGTIQTNVFSVTGKVFDSRPATALEMGRTTYRRTAQGTRLEVFAGSSNTSSLCFRESIALIGTPPSPCQTTMLSDNNGHFFAHNPAPAPLPPLVVVTASAPSGSTKPTSASSRVIDVVKVSNARYSWADKRLTIEARSSDEVAVPDLVVQGFGRMSKAGPVQTLTVNDLAQPPASVLVKSSAGGEDSEDVTVVGSAPEEPSNQPPVGLTDTASTSFGVPVTIAVLANDSDPDDNTPLSVTGLTPPPAGQGTVALNGTTTVVYTPPAVVNTPLSTSFTYRVQDNLGAQSAPVTVNVTVSPNQAPNVVNDTGATLGVPLTLAVLTNDADPEGNGPLTVINLTQPTRGTASTDGTSITYTPPAGVTAAFSTSFTYQARDSLGAVSAPATVTINVSPPPVVAENLAITTADVVARSNARHTFSVDGTSSLTTGNSITVTVQTTTGPVVIGSAVVPASGRWRLSATTTGLVLPATTTATIRSSFNNVRTVTLVNR
ncbi:cadherin-like domain-containing protein [Pseudomonas sp. UL073]|uniref:Cadherin-like domain-containing protein n=1 Tax=Zestomonas insulae TaxID=2809017 RepID=A0ABS2I7Q6_9GAMM|nr:Ig-like domain-containing protein [Pseudomonas insulae]MBM7059184.1 cadherin-like domain-containing protein [Pseudomonas insulae]